MDPTDLQFIGQLGATFGAGAVGFYFCLSWVKEIKQSYVSLLEERLGDQKEWNEFLRGEREKDRENLRILTAAIQDLARLANSSIKPTG